ncbi:MAG TPA: ATP-binding protein [Kiritimatiellia bacterium]|nr:ATP-binding protein [Kiritimatiellia bacterium]HMO97595.1 ATP-binding protein [Kiritimatiellia bacterium]
MLDRPLYEKAWQTLSQFKSMIFLAGPRQAGKTTFAEALLANRDGVYLNSDIPEDRTRLLKNPAFYHDVIRTREEPPFVVLDEIHKMPRWKNYLKGAYDRDKDRFSFLVLGSGRLDQFRRGGDSLAGRYLMFHLWPFTLAELAETRRSPNDFLADPMVLVPDFPSENAQRIWSRLRQYSGFPEPYIHQSSEFRSIWSMTYHRQIIRDDIREQFAILKAAEITQLLDLLPLRVGSPVAMDHLAGDLHVAPDTVKKWVGLFDAFYLIFTIKPWTRKVSRALTKMPKLYFFDYARVEDPAARLENMVALELYRATQSWTDLGHGTFTLHYLRNREKQEVDFLIARDQKPFLLIECKSSDTQVSPALKKFQQMLRVPAVQLVENIDGFKRYEEAGLPLLIAPAWRWLAQLP